MPKITELYAYVIADADEDDEGIPAFGPVGGMMMPMVGADWERAESLRNIAQTMADKAGKPIKLIRSMGVELVDTIQPEEKQNGSTN